MNCSYLLALSDEASRSKEPTVRPTDEPSTSLKEELKEAIKEDKKIKRARKELESLKDDIAGRAEADRTAVRRRIETFIARNDEISKE